MEGAVHIAIENFFSIVGPIDAVVDGLLLIIVLFPFLYFFIYRPLWLKRISEQKEKDDAIANRLDQLDAIYQLNDTINRAATMEEIYAKAFDTLQQLLKADRVSICLAGPDKEMTISAWRGLSDAFREETAKFLMSTEENADYPVFIPDIREDSRMSFLLPTFLHEGIKAFGLIPLVSRGAMMGRIAVYYDGLHVFSPEESQLVQTIAGHVAYAIDRKQQEESRQRLMAILEATTDFVAIANPDGTVTYMNRAARRMIETGADEDISKIRIPDTHPDWVNRLIREEAHPAAIREGIWEGETAFISRSGKEIPTHQMIMAHKGPDGTLQFLSTIVRDLTEKKKTEDLQERLKKILETTTDYVIMVDSQGKAQFINRSARKILGIGEKDLPSFTGREIYPAWANKLVLETVIPVVLRDGVWQGEAVLLGHDGQEIPVSQVIMAHRDPDGVVKYYSTIARDLTEQKKSENSLRQNESQLKEAQQLARTGSWELDLINNKLTWSDEIYRIYEVDPERFGASYEAFLDTLHPEDRAAVDQAYKASVKNRTPYAVDHRLLFPGGRIKHVHTRCETYYDNDGAPIRSVGTTQDITERILAEESLKQKNLLLELIGKAQSQFITLKDTKQLFDGMLSNLLSLTGSAYGFIGEVAYATEGKPYLKSHAITNIAWTKELREFYQENASKGIEFRKMASLYGSVITTGKPVISNNPVKDPRAGGLPEGHPELNSFLGLPIYAGDKFVGMVGMANREGGYDGEIVNFLSPFLSTCGHLIEAANNENLRRKAEESLKRSEARLARAQQIAQIGSWERDLLTNKIYWSEEVYRIFGVEPGQLNATFEGFISFVHPEDRTIVASAIEETLIRKSPYRVNYRLVRNDGAIRFVRAEGEIVSDHEDKPVRLVGVVQDITDSHMAEEAVRKSEARLEKAQRIAHMGSWEWDLASNKLYWSDQVYQIYGLELQSFEPSYEKFLSVVHPEDRKKVAIEPDNLLDLPLQTEYRIVRPDGSVRIIQGNREFSLDENGRIVRVAGIIQDVTEKKRLEDQIRSMQRMESIGALAGGVAHDFNNILTAIQGFAELSILSVSEEYPQQFMGEIKTASERAANLTRQLLLFSRQQPMTLKDTQMNDVVLDLLKMLHRVVGEHYTLSTNLARKLKPIYADRSHLEQVIMNLVVNARDAMPDGGEILIHTKKVTIDEAYCKRYSYARNGEFICVSVKDQGVGMDAATLARIFEPFFTTKGPGKGTGLGLSVVYGIVKQHNGWITVDSEPGSGSTVQVYLPVLGEKKSKSPEKAELATLQLGGEGVILLVEDDDVVRRFTERVLKKNGYTVISAGNVQEAVEIFSQEKEKLDLLLSDVVLPDGTGVKLADSLLKEKPQLPVLFTSGYSHDTIGLQAALREKDYLFLPKPYGVKDLLLAVRSVLQRGGSE